jgi:N-acetylmuramoyl-L-alanine amidase
MKVALVVGHNSKSRGAFSEFLGETEFDFYKQVALEIKDKFQNSVDVIFRNYKGSYEAEMQEVIDIIGDNYDFVVELHFNSFNGIASGCEVLHWHSSKSGIELAERFIKATKEIIGNNIRGRIEIKSSSDRGGYGIVKSKPPYILVEPFFGDSAIDTKDLTKDKVVNLLTVFLEATGLSSNKDEEEEAISKIRKSIHVIELELNKIKSIINMTKTRDTRDT